MLCAPWICTQTFAEAPTGGAPRSTEPTDQPPHGRGGADRADLAAGELASGVVTTDGFPATRWTSAWISSQLGSFQLGSLTARLVKAR
jgi:hypothetical protein